ncbi:MAG: HAMP domain-containing protein [Candidatus Riflebacteria bacterium]|nr:HAMP domain-containing protein [Candidatus Riflebacteria bacterium]
MSRLSSEKYNILLIVLIFVIPLIAINLSYLFISKINFDWAEKEQKKEAIQEAETLSAESNFSTEFAFHFRDFFDEIQSIVKSDKTTNSNLTSFIKQSADKIFEAPFPKFNLYVFNIPNKKRQAELIYSESYLNTGKRTLCKAFEHLYNLNIGSNNKPNESFAKNLLGRFSNLKAIAHDDMRGITTYTNGIHKNSYFIWDYADIGDKGIYGVILLCSELDNQAEYGRLLALKKLKSRRKALGAFIPIFEEYGEANLLFPLDKSDIFKKWADSLIIKNKDKIDHWLMESLPQNSKLGNYSAFCHLDRNLTHIAVVLVKSIKIDYSPKWLIIINISFILTLSIILYLGIGFGIWPQLNLRTRFIVSYALAAVVPLSILCVAAYGYLLEFENTSVEQANNELQLSLRTLDSHKLKQIRKYKVAFNKLVNDSKLNELLKTHGVDSKKVTDYVVNYYENRDCESKLPIYGVRFYDAVGRGGFATGSAALNKDIKNLVDSFNSVQVELLRDEIIKEKPDTILEEYKNDNDNSFAENAYFSLAGRHLKIDMSKHFALPIPRKNGDFCGYQIFDIIKIDGETKYMLLVLWDDKTLDEKIIQNAIKNNDLKNINQNFIAYKINGTSIDFVEETRHASKNLKNEIFNHVKQASFFKKTDTFVYDNNIVVIMPSFNFNQIVFVGWINKIGIINKVFERMMAFVFLIIISVFTLWICSLRSSAVFLKPISLLKKALDEVSTGNLNIGFKDNPDNEIGKLSNEFGNMIMELREKERLSKLISEQAVQALKKNSSNLLSDTETFNGVALVSDIRNFTGMSEQYDPIIITELLNEHFAEMSKIISDNGGLIYKYIGDAIEAVFPEKSEYETSSYERAFKAASKMIYRLKTINIRRKNKNLFTYRIGVGLSSGTMHSGSVGSLETRLDYPILGDPLKNAAKFEALTIQNPLFPLVVDEKIAEKMTSFGLGFRKIDSKNLDFNLYTLNEIVNIEKSDSLLPSEKELFVNQNEEQKENISYFSLSSNLTSFKKIKEVMFFSFFIFIIILLVTFGIKLINDTNYDSLKSDSDKYSYRLIEQLKCDDVLKSSFETLCFDFYDDLKKININKNSKNLKKEVKQIALKYEKLGVPIPKYCCCFLDESIISESERIVYNGFSEDISILMNNFTKSYKEYIEKNSKKEKELEREELIDLGEDYFENDISSFTSKVTRFYDFQQGVYFRRSSSITLGKEDMLFDTERIYDDSHNNLIAYIFCGMPENINKDLLPNYYTLLAGKQMLMALKNDNGWYFSPDFPENEKELFKNSNNESIIKKGYYIPEEKIYINNEPFSVFIISKDLYFNYYSSNKLIIIAFILSVIILTIFLWYLEKIKKVVNNSIASILRKEMFLSAILPILTVCFVAYLFVVEESNVNKADLVLDLNQQMNELESREYYYSPFCEYYLKKLPSSKDIHDFISKIHEAKKEEREKECEALSNHLKKNVAGRNYKNNSLKLESVYPFFVIKEIMFIGKDDWVAAAKHSNKDEKKSSPFGDLISKIVKASFFDKNKSSNTNNNNESIKNEMISEKTLEILSSAYGSDVALRLTNLPNNLLIVANSYSSIALYIGCFPKIINPDFAIVSLIYFDNEFKPDICNKKNDSIISYKTHLDSGSIDNKLFCFYSPNINVGEFFFHDGWYNNKREELQTVKELGLASSWINTSYLPLSKKVDINGIHYLEARQGNIIKDNVYVALGSEYPIRHKAFYSITFFGLFLIFSLFMIFMIAQSIISDLLYPVRKLIEGAGAASRGNYIFRTEFQRKDELGALCLSFDKMMKGLEEKQLINRMVSKTALKAASKVSNIESKKVNVALLYVTVPNFDKIMKNMPVSELFNKLRQQIAVIAKIVIENGGDIDKIMGEKLLIAFHLGEKTAEEIATNASKAASIIKSCDKLYFNVAVGVNFGEVISGYLGVGEKRDFTIIGDPVNVTARIAVFSEKIDKCLISETIYKYISNNINAEFYGEVELKGKSKPMKVYQII